MLMKTLNYERDTSQGKTHHFIHSSFPLALLLCDCWLACQRAVVEISVSPVDIIPPWFSMLIYHLGDEE
jgi:hypothetical protein